MKEIFRNYSQSIFHLILAAIPLQRCIVNEECVNFCDSHGYNKSDCATRALRLSRICECSECDFVKCAKFCTNKGLKFVGCNCFNLPFNNFPAMENSVYNPITNDCSENKFFCQCSK